MIELLRATPWDEPLVIETDSQCVVKIVTEWLDKWRSRGMRTARGQPVENQDLIERLDAALDSRAVTFEWVRGHAGHRLNERADALANAAARRAADRLAADP